MIEVELSDENIRNIYHNLRDEDLKEVEYFIGKNNIDDFIRLCKASTKTHLLKSLSGDFLAIGGLNEVQQNDNVIGQIWLLCTQHAYKNKKELYKYIIKKIDCYKSEYNFLFNYIFETNFSALYWLKRSGFKCLDLNNKKMKFFYYKKGDMNFDL